MRSPLIDSTNQASAARSTNLQSNTVRETRNQPSRRISFVEPGGGDDDVLPGGGDEDVLCQIWWRPRCAA
ncbi:hypothetical protein QQ045_022785 [Rhodiola kirilowii]